MRAPTLIKLIILLILVSGLDGFGQTKAERNKIISKTNVKFLKEFAKQSEEQFNAEKQKALKMAKEKGWVIREEKDGVLRELMRVTDDGQPVYYVTYNADAAVSTRANTLHNGGSLGLNIEGQGMTAHVWDGGLARSSHQEYDGPGGTNRFSIGDGTTTLHYHSAHVTGTIIASGVEAQAKGMAPQAYAIGYEWNNDQSEATTAASGGMLLSNHSYGFGADAIPDAWFGQYGSDAVAWDGIMYSAPYYLMVSSAGNDGADDSSNASPLDGNSAYDKLSGDHTNKNGLVVANAQDALIEGEELVSVTINSSSSEGPTDDYRIKPDITGNGTGVYSSYEDADDSYNSISGTSMASPNVCGSLLLLQQYYNSLYSNFMKAATLKGLALHTADDAGTAGPDAIFGWGLLNTRQAARTITNNGDETIISELTLNDGGSYSIDVVSDGLTDLVVSISWTDPAGTANSGTNSSTPALVNDLDVRVTQNSNTYYPYRLTSITTNANDGDNIVDPYEKIIIAAASGTYTINVTHKGSLTSGSQDYSLIVTGCQGTPAAPMANFNANSLMPMVTTETVNFYDLSENLPTTWSWSFSPSTVSFVDGTYFTSQNPKVRFNASGLYQVTLTATNAQGNDTEVKTDYINVISNCSHCYSYGSTDYGADFSITNVAFNTINNSSTNVPPLDANGYRYSDYTSTSTTVTAESSYNLTLTLYANSANYPLAGIAWIDWNQDCDFDDPGEEYDLGTRVNNGTLSSYSISIPSTALEGNTIMRVSCNYDSPASSCETGVWGEVEDYTINVINSCANPSGLTAAGITMSEADLFWINNSSAANWDIEWGVSPYSFTGSPTENDVTDNPFSLSGLSSATTYEFYVRADCGADNTDVSDWVGPQSFTTLAGPPSISGVDIDDFYMDQGDEIIISGSNLINATSVEIGGISGSIGANTSGSITVTFPAGAYANNTLTVTTASGSDTYTMNLQTRTSLTVGGGTSPHSTIQSALDGLSAWKGTTAFSAPITIEVYGGTYAEKVTPDVSLNPTADYPLIIKNRTGEAPVIDASGETNGVYIGTLDYMQLRGFTVHGASGDNIYSEGVNNTISFIQSYGSTGGSGISVNGTDATVTNNLCYSNYNYGIHVNGANATIYNNTLDDNGHSFTPLVDQTLFSEAWETGVYTGWTISTTGSANWTVTTGDAANDASTGSAYANFTTSANNNSTTGTLSYSNTPEIDISGYTNIVISCQVKSVNIDNGETFYGEYQIDGGGWNSISNAIGSTTSYSTYENATPIATSGSFLEIRFVATNNRTNEKWYLDDISVIGDESGSAGAVGAGLYVESGAGTDVQNNIVVAKTGDDAYYALETDNGITVSSSYNTYYTTNTNLFNYDGTVDNIGPIGTGDLTGDPLFVGTGNYHVQATEGTFVSAKAPIWPPDAATGGTWDTDSYSTDSPTIDAGNPTHDFSSEANGGGTAIDQGSFGNTPQSSKGVGTLPVVWKAYNAKCENGAIQINWSTFSEINNDYFTIEKITFDKFETIARVGGAGNSLAVNSYSYVDDNIESENYYRIKQTDYDGQIAYSPIFHAKCNELNPLMEEPIFNIYPNPFNNQVVLEILNCKANKVSIDIVNNIGITLGHRSLITDNSKNSIIKLNTSTLPQGIYFLKITVGDREYSRKIIKN